jgi:hypothetical protein
MENISELDEKSVLKFETLRSFRAFYASDPS